MSFNDRTDRMDWKDEFVWIAISVVSGVLLAYLYYYFERFQDESSVVIGLICCVAFYVLSILVRIQNHRGQALTGKTAFDESKLKWIFPIVGFAIGFSVLLF